MSPSVRESKLPGTPGLRQFVWLLYQIRGSLIVFIFTLGFLSFIGGILLRTGEMAAMLGIWGASFMTYAVLGFLLMRLVRTF